MLLALPVICISCIAESSDGVKPKEQTMTFSLKNAGYPVEFANYQRNSYVPVEAKREWKGAWSKRFAEIDPEMPISPRAVLATDSVVAAKTASELFVFATSGKFQFFEATNNPSPVVLGAGAMAYFNANAGLVYQDYNRKKLKPEEPVPGFDQWAYALLIRPTMDEVLGVVQNAGIRGQSGKKHYIYRFVRGALAKKWSYQFDGIVNHALLTADEKTLVTVTGEEIALYDAESGKSDRGFKTGLPEPLAASLDLAGGLVVIGKIEDTAAAKKILKAFSPAGEELWSIDLVNPALVQPPACGEGGTVYVVDNGCLQCIADGAIKWTTPPIFGAGTCVTVTKGNHLLVLDGALLCLFDPAGEKIFKSMVSMEGEAFGVPPAVDAHGRIYVLSEKSLYCLE